jgi:glycosyltransferase involved in cell wall biosynthesis
MASGSSWGETPVREAFGAAHPAASQGGFKNGAPVCNRLTSRGFECGKPVTKRRSQLAKGLLESALAASRRFGSDFVNGAGCVLAYCEERSSPTSRKYEAKQRNKATMHIAQVAPLYESVPPKYYGGTERVVSYLTEALVAMGHEVTLYASGDSLTRARLRPGCESALRLDPSSTDPVADHIYLAEKVCQEAGEFEFVHSHMDYLALPLLRRMRTPHVTTLHGRLNITNLVNLYHEFSDEPLTSISNHQRIPLEWANWQATVHHGLPEDMYSFHEHPGKYLAFLGRFSPEKRAEDAIEIARRVGLPLKIAAKVARCDREYFDGTISPLLKQKHVEYVGEIGEQEKDEFLGKALALLFPIDWPEPFGLVMIEALACGTPVIARGRGSVPEIIDDGITGFVFEEVGEAVQAVVRLSEVSRKRCRQTFDERFTARRMAQDYLKVYQRLIQAQRASRSSFGRASSFSPRLGALRTRPPFRDAA